MPSHVPMETLNPTPDAIETTLFDLMDAMLTEVEPDDEAWVVPAVLHLLRSGRITFMGRALELRDPIDIA